MVRNFHRLYPEAELFTLACDHEKIGGFFNNLKINTSFIQKLPLALRHLRWYLWLMPVAVESFNLNEYDVIISSASAFAKGVISPPRALHVCYCHTPTRYLWSDAAAYVQEIGGGGLIKTILPLILNRLRIWDQLAANRVDYFIANSQFVANRIKRYYNRESAVIYPPVDVENYPVLPKRKYFIIVSRLRPYKKVDLAVRAFNRLNMPLLVVGEGEEMGRLKKMASRSVRFTGAVSEGAKKRLLAGALGFIHPQEEDFGIAAVEAMAAGTPVIAYDAGGVRETVKDGESGVFFEEQTWQSLADAVIRFRRFSAQGGPASGWDYEKIRRSAQRFSEKRFLDEIKSFVEKKHHDHRH